MEYATKLSTSFELNIEKMKNEDIFIFQTILHMIQTQKKLVKIIIGLNMNIKPDCFKLAIVPPHKQIIQNLVIKLLD
jgi:hypothetical protein